MVKHTQTICCLLPTNFLSVFDHFVGLKHKGLSYNLVNPFGPSYHLWRNRSDEVPAEMLHFTERITPPRLFVMHFSVFRFRDALYISLRALVKR